jgi:hypothetical protein
VITTVVNDRGYSGAGGTGLGTDGLVFGSNVGIAAPLAVTNVQVRVDGVVGWAVGGVNGRGWGRSVGG